MDRDLGTESAPGTTRVLALEDTESDVLLLQTYLYDGGGAYHLEVVGTLRELLARIRGYERASALRNGVAPRAWDVLLVDLCVPDSEGIDTVRAVRNAAPWLPIVVQSAFGEADVGVQAVRAGAQDYLTKGKFNGELLRRALRYAIERKAGERALRDSEERYAISVRGAKDGIWDWDLREGSVYYSSRWMALLGYDEDEVEQTPEAWFALVHPEDRELLAAAISAHVEGLSDQLEHEYRALCRDGSVRWVLTRGMALRTPDGRAYRMAGSLTDVTDRKLAEERLRRESLHDKLTSLPNRALCLNRIGQAMRRHRRDPDTTFSVLFIDVDRFKLINDSLGHARGDELLRRFARRIEQLVRPGDTFARLAGDEFCIVLESVGSLEQAGVVAQRIEQALREPFDVDGHEIFVSVSIGIAEGSANHRSPADIIRDADLAMYRAKRNGKARHEVFDAGLRERAVSRLELDTDLRHALERDEFRLHYQPIVEMEHGQLVGFEALLRWESPSRGLVFPDVFLDVAEDTGLIVDIGRWVLDHAIGALAACPPVPGGPPLSVSVNLSPRQFRRRDLADAVEAALERYELDPTRLILEITEHTVLEHTHVAQDTFARLKALGVAIDLDDFGTGWSSLSCLRQFAFDRLKIDKSFVAGMSRSASDREIVRAVLALGHNLGMEVVAEGIETGLQLSELRALGCEFGQGYLFSRPQQACDSGEWLARTGS